MDVMVRLTGTEEKFFGQYKETLESDNRKISKAEVFRQLLRQKAEAMGVSI